jgi:hypothetical protein
VDDDATKQQMAARRGFAEAGKIRGWSEVDDAVTRSMRAGAWPVLVAHIAMLVTDQFRSANTSFHAGGA